MNKSRISWITQLPWWYAIFWLVIAIFLYHYQWPHLGNIKIPNVSLPRYHVRRTKLINDNPFGTVACLKWIFQYYYMRSSKKNTLFSIIHTWNYRRSLPTYILHGYDHLESSKEGNSRGLHYRHLIQWFKIKTDLLFIPIFSRYTLLALDILKARCL